MPIVHLTRGLAEHLRLLKNRREAQDRMHRKRLNYFVPALKTDLGPRMFDKASTEPWKGSQLTHVHFSLCFPPVRVEVRTSGVPEHWWSCRRKPRRCEASARAAVASENL